MNASWGPLKAFLLKHHTLVYEEIVRLDFCCWLRTCVTQKRIYLQDLSRALPVVIDSLLASWNQIHQVAPKLNSDVSFVHFQQLFLHVRTYPNFELTQGTSDPNEKAFEYHLKHMRFFLPLLQVFCKTLGIYPQPAQTNVQRILIGCFILKRIWSFHFLNALSHFWSISEGESFSPFPQACSNSCSTLY